MLNILPNAQPQEFGLFESSNACLFELSDAGTVLYCRNNTGVFSGEKSRETIGCDFFTEAAPFENVEEFRFHFNRFIKR